MDLRRDDVYVKPFYVDWYDALSFESGEPRAEIVYPDLSDWTVAECLTWCQDEGYENATNDILDYELDDDECDDDIQRIVSDLMQDEPSRFEPMMNYAYPVTLGVTAEAVQARLLRDAPNLVVVEYDGQDVLALSAGGMDFSWDIARAYISLGQLPPLHFCDLPDMAGEYDESVVLACRETIEVIRRDLVGTEDRLNGLAGFPERYVINHESGAYHIERQVLRYGGWQRTGTSYSGITFAGDERDMTGEYSFDDLPDEHFRDLMREGA